MRPFDFSTLKLRPLDAVLPDDSVLPRDWLLPATDELLERTLLLALATLLEPGARVLVAEERPVALRPLELTDRRALEERPLAVLLEAERARAVTERALEAPRALE